MDRESNRENLQISPVRPRFTRESQREGKPTLVEVSFYRLRYIMRNIVEADPLTQPSDIQRRVPSRARSAEPDRPQA